jgi:hypothetical protein
LIIVAPPVPPPWMRYGACHQPFKDASDDDLRDALFELRDCAKEIDAERLRVADGRGIFRPLV